MRHPAGFQHSMLGADKPDIRSCRYFHQLPKRLKAFRALQLVVIIVEFPILLIHIVIRSKISSMIGFKHLRHGNPLPSPCCMHWKASDRFSRSFCQVHFSPLFTEFRNGKSVYDCTDIFRNKSANEPLYQHLIHGKESVALHQIVHSHSCKCRKNIQPLATCADRASYLSRYRTLFIRLSRNAMILPDL